MRFIAKLAADPHGDFVALVERRGERPPFGTVVHVYNGRTAELLTSFDGPRLSYLRIAVRGDRVLVGDHAKGTIVGFDLAGNVAWGPINVEPETLYSLAPSLDGEFVLARVKEPRGERRVVRVLGIDPGRGSFSLEQTAAFAALPLNINEMLLCSCVVGGIVVASGWTADTSGRVRTSKLDAMFGVTSPPLVPRLVGVALAGKSTRLLWQRDGQFADVAALPTGDVLGLVSNDGIDEETREKTHMLATAALLQLDAKTGAEKARVDLGEALANTRDAAFFAFGTRLVSTDGAVRDVTNGSVVASLR